MVRTLSPESGSMSELEARKLQAEQATASAATAEFTPGTQEDQVPFAGCWPSTASASRRTHSSM